ncbi:MAG: hypothetical protein ACRD0D_13315, partial [Acidimicrobiales bacterium]
TCAALLIGAGRRLEEIKDHLGHSSIRVTSDRYGHLFPEAREAVRDSLDRAFREARMRGSADSLRTPGAGGRPRLSGGEAV